MEALRYIRQLSQFISDGIRIAGLRNAINQKAATAAGRGRGRETTIERTEMERGRGSRKERESEKGRGTEEKNLN